MTERLPLALLLLVFWAPTEIEAWPSEAYRGMVYDALALMPPSLGRVLARRDEALLSGVSTLEGETASLIARDGLRGELSRELIEDVETRIERVVRMVGEHRPFRETAVELGKLLRIAADLSDPVVVGAGSPELRRVAPEYIRFVALHLAQIPLVHDGSIPSPVAGASVERILGGVASRTGASIAPLSEAFWKDGRVVPATSFDFRSVPYAETSLSYSRGVTAASYLWLSAWTKANGDFTGYRFAPKKR
ncbi:MAG TPA: hypothetical protein VIE88_08580 [Vicinamibacteria bacterium]|jgi:hypothetical protein